MFNQLIEPSIIPVALASSESGLRPEHHRGECRTDTGQSKGVQRLSRHEEVHRRRRIDASMVAQFNRCLQNHQHTPKIVDYI